MADVEPQHRRPGGSADELAPQAEALRCLACQSPLKADGDALECTSCRTRFPVQGGVVRMVDGSSDPDWDVKQATGDSFGYEWEHFGGLRPEWEENFRGYMQPLNPAQLSGLLVLDVGTGSGRHANQAAANGARVVGVDLGAAIEVARANTPASVLCVQSDAEQLPFEPASFDLVMSIGVLHHLPDPDRALRSVARYVRPGGRLQVYLYWQPEIAWHRAVLKGVTTARRVTTRIPHPLLRALCYPLSALLWPLAVLPQRVGRRRPRLRRLVAQLPLKTYADYPFGVLVNDQFDRLSAPLERRYTADEVRVLLESTGLEDITVIGHHGWVAGGTMPAAG